MGWAAFGWAAVGLAASCAAVSVAKSVMKKDAEARRSMMSRDYLGEEVTTRVRRGNGSTKQGDSGQIAAFCTPTPTMTFVLLLLLHDIAISSQHGRGRKYERAVGGLGRLVARFA